ncbi:hypothetical protein TD95_001583 [Thielaviopsis punctulata]|uniref:Uncharacterized protein n=1 Tax=Thielaviopsis punctulata TaxID=72032 RepID=A0A0F4ZHB5_9PEZI|nr:hypothetical protein TD95_001583 [Thielaviopsis punctulata]
MTQGSPEQLLEAFKAAALSVTKLYKTSAAEQSKARLEGYQDCIEDLLAFLDRENIGLGDGEGWVVRSWATERLNGDPGMNTGDSDDDESSSAAEPSHSAPPSIPSSSAVSSVTSLPSSATAHARTPTTTTSTPAPAAGRPTMISSEIPTMPPTRPTSHEMPAPSEIGSFNPSMAPVSAPSLSQPSTPSSTPIKPFPSNFTVPTADSFTFQSGIAYPNIDQLALSDATPSAPRTSLRPRNVANTASRNQQSRHLGRGAGQKRRINIAEIFDVGDLGNGKDMFGNMSKRNRHN